MLYPLSYGGTSYNSIRGAAAGVNSPSSECAGESAITMPDLRLEPLGDQGALARFADEADALHWAESVRARGFVISRESFSALVCQIPVLDDYFERLMRERYPNEPSTSLPFSANVAKAK
jgi:hypothetical protein